MYKKTAKMTVFLKNIQLNTIVEIMINVERAIPSSKDITITPRLENLGFQRTWSNLSYKFIFWSSLLNTIYTFYIYLCKKIP